MIEIIAPKPRRTKAYYKRMGALGWQAKIDKHGEKKARKLQRKAYEAGLAKKQA